MPKEVIKVELEVDKSQVEELERRLEGLQDEDVKITVSADDSEIQAVERQLDSIEDEEVEINVDSTGVESAFDKLKDLAGPAALGGVIAGIGALGATGIQAGAELQELSTISGLSVESLQKLGAAAKAGGGNVEDVADAAREMQLRLAEATKLGSGPAVEALQLLGITLEDLAGLSVDEQFLLLRDAISGVVDPAERLFIQEELLGGSTERLNSLLTISNAEYQALTENLNIVSAAEASVNAQIQTQANLIKDEAIAALASYTATAGVLLDRLGLMDIQFDTSLEGLQAIHAAIIDGGRDWELYTAVLQDAGIQVDDYYDSNNRLHTYLLTEALEAKIKTLEADRNLTVAKRDQTSALLEYTGTAEEATEATIKYAAAQTALISVVNQGTQAQYAYANATRASVAAALAFTQARQAAAALGPVDPNYVLGGIVGREQAREEQVERDQREQNRNNRATYDPLLGFAL